MFSTDDTIVAIATPAGRAGLGVVRISGSVAPEIARRLLARDTPLVPRHATLTTVRDLVAPPSAAAPAAPGLDKVVATFFPRPGSYTGEDTIELSAHGSPLVLGRIVASAVHAGARLARPGEFTFRAYLNGKLDLVQAEAVADLIDAVTPAQVRQAFDQLEGTLTRSIADVGSRLFDLIVKLEASLDFPEEGYHFVEPNDVVREISQVREAIVALLASARQGRVVREGRHVVLVGAPNVGKSSVFNALVGVDRAIVTPVPGTTRDLVTEQCDIGGIPVTLVDTAGLREANELVEQEGIRRTERAAGVAALVVLVVDRSRPLSEAHEATSWGMLADTPRLVVANKSDLDGVWAIDDLSTAGLAVSARTGAGMSDLRRRIVGALAGGEELRDTPRVSNVRHIARLEETERAVGRAIEAARVSAPEELILADLQGARTALDEIMGRHGAEDVLRAIFDRFCIGK